MLMGLASSVLGGSGGGGLTSGLTGGSEGPSSASSTTGDFFAGSLNVGESTKDSVIKYAVIGVIALTALVVIRKGKK